MIFPYFAFSGNIIGQIYKKVNDYDEELGDEYKIKIVIMIVHKINATMKVKCIYTIETYSGGFDIFIAYEGMCYLTVSSLIINGVEIKSTKIKLYNLDGPKAINKITLESSIKDNNYYFRLEENNNGVYMLKKVRHRELKLNK